MQATLKTKLEFRGRGLHSGAPATLRLLPYPAHMGLWFKRSDVTDRDALIPARWDAVTETRLCTRLANRDGATVSTVEHVMAALAAMGVDNALIEVDGPEVPILDGSALPFARAIAEAGLAPQDGDRRMLRVLESVEVRDGDRLARLDPAPRLEIDVSIDFADPAIGRQQVRLAPTPGAFLAELADCRTFCLAAEIEAMQAAGLARGGSLDNAVVVENGRVLNPGGLRRADEFVRHKALDVVGDLGLAPAPLLARYTGVRSGHEMTNRVLRALAARPWAWRLEAATPDLVAA
ncbi:MAG: UDP-3-O-acyl-N-acetylglucosamine deacetylase [Pseudomonadota bacterium]